MLLLSEAMAALPPYSDDEGQDDDLPGSDEEDDTKGGDKDGVFTRDDTNPRPPLPHRVRTLESINASKIDQMTHDIKLLSQSASLLASSKGVREVAVKMEGIKRERGVPELIVVAAKATITLIAPAHDAKLPLKTQKETIGQTAKPRYTRNRGTHLSAKKQSPLWALPSAHMAKKHKPITPIRSNEEIHRTKTGNLE
jgi:hypothetical protein